MKISPYSGGRSFIIELDSRNESFEKLIIENKSSKEICKTIISYCDALKCAWPEVEDILLDKAESHEIINYAEIIKNRFIKGEKKIARSSAAIKSYLDFLDEAKVPTTEKQEAVNNIEHHFLNHLEACQLDLSLWNGFDKMKGYQESNPSLSACQYCIDVKKTRWPEAESIIMKDSRAIYIYAKTILKDRWIEAEPYIMQTEPESDYGWHLYGYFCDIMNGYGKCPIRRWIEAEPYIMKFPKWAYQYSKKIMGGRWPEAEPYIAKSPEFAYEYAHTIVKGRWPEAEPYIAESPRLAYEYAKRIIKGRLPEEMHNRIMVFAMQNPNDPYIKKYFGYKKYRKEKIK